MLTIIRNQIKSVIWNLMHYLYNSIRRIKLQNTGFSIVCNNCTGAMVTHDLGQRFNSPTVNLFIKANEYILFLSHLKDNLNANIIDVTGSNSYPIGLLNGKIHLFFMHYNSFEEARDAWIRRCRRINYNNLFLVFIERDGCTYQNLLDFDNLPFGKKVALVHKSYPQIKCAKIISGYEDKNEVGFITNKIGLLGRHIYDKYDWVSFLNSK